MLIFMQLQLMRVSRDGTAQELKALQAELEETRKQMNAQLEEARHNLNTVQTSLDATVCQ